VYVYCGLGGQLADSIYARTEFWSGSEMLEHNMCDTWKVKTVDEYL
jgi:hypothetical protein